jgi:hypothetical protein
MFQLTNNKMLIMTGFILVLYLFFQFCSCNEHFTNPSVNTTLTQTLNSPPTSSSIVTPPIPPTSPTLSVTQTDSVDNLSNTKITILGYNTHDGGVKVTWQRPEHVVDYMAIIKDEEGGEAVKMYFKDTLSPECKINECSYSFDNLANGKKHSLVIATITKDGMSDLSKPIFFIPTLEKMKCNANGTCQIIKEEVDPNLTVKVARIMEDQVATKKLITDCQSMVKKNNAIYDINKIYNVDGSFGDVKDKLGYPEHLLLPIKQGPNSLAELVKNQLELGIMNINVHNYEDAKNVKLSQ